MGQEGTQYPSFILLRIQVTETEKGTEKEGVQAPTVFQFHNIEILHPPPIFIPDMECTVALAVAAVAVAVIIDSIVPKRSENSSLLFFYN